METEPRQDQWFYARQGQQRGPVSEQALRESASRSELQPSDLVWCEGWPAWRAASTVAGLFAAGTTPPPLPPLPMNYVRPMSPPALEDQPGMRFILPVGLSPWAIAAGYMGLFAILFLPAPLAVIFGLIAIRDIRLHPRRRGMGRAVFGLVMGAVCTIGFFIMLAIALN
jgi:hypothetical protein